MRRRRTRGLRRVTGAGRAAIEAAAPGHVEEVRRLVFDGLSTEDVRVLGDLQRTILARLTAEQS